MALAKYDQGGRRPRPCAGGHRPVDEPLSVSLRRLFDTFVDLAADPERTARSIEMDRVVNSSESLRGAYLGRIERIQERLTVAAEHRATVAGSSKLPPVAPRAAVAAHTTADVAGT